MKRGKEEKRKRIQSSQSACARVPLSARGTHVFRFLLVLLALTDDASTRRFRHACSFTRLHERRTRGRATMMKIRRQASESWWLPSGIYIQQVISRHFRRHFYFRDTTSVA